MTGVSIASSDSPLVDRVLAGTGLLALGVTSLVYPASSQIYAEPISLAYAVLLTIPVIALLTQSATRSTWALPSRIWTVGPLLLGLVILLSAWLSPYQPTVLRWSSLPLAAIALFFWISTWLNRDRPARSESLLRALAIGTSALSSVSLLQWTAQLLRHGFGPGLLEWLGAVRNPFPLGHSNYTAGFVVLGLPFLVHAAYRAKATARTVWISATFIALLALITSGSRGGLIGLGVLIVASVFNLKLRPRSLLLLLAVGAVTLTVVSFTHPRIRSLIGPSDPSAPPNISSVQRLAMAEAGFAMGRDRPVWGWGLHSTPLVYPRYRAQLDGGAENVLQLHSAPIELWAGLGGLGLGISGILILLALSQWRRQPAAAIALLGYTAFALTDYQLDLPVILAGLAVTIALLAPPSSRPFRLERLPKILIAAGTITTTGIVLLIGREDPTPRLNIAALTLAQNPELADRAIGLLEDSLSLNPDQEIAHFNLGWLKVVSRPAEAESHFRSALQLVPDKGGAYFGLGLARLNQNHPDRAARAFALECLNDPTFINSPWWQVPTIADHRDATQLGFEIYLEKLATQLPPNSWAGHQITALRQRAPELGIPPPGPERTLRRERTGYPVLMRNLNLPPPVDLFDVRESLNPPPHLPSKGWIPSPLLLSLLDESSSEVQ